MRDKLSNRDCSTTGTFLGVGRLGRGLRQRDLRRDRESEGRMGIQYGLVGRIEGFRKTL